LQKAGIVLYTTIIVISV